MEQNMNRNTNMNQQEQTAAYFAHELQRERSLRTLSIIGKIFSLMWRGFCTIIKVSWEICKALK